MSQLIKAERKLMISAPPTAAQKMRPHFAVCSGPLLSVIPALAPETLPSGTNFR